MLPFRKLFNLKKVTLPFLKPLKEFASQASSFADLLPYAEKHENNIVLCTDGSLLATYRYKPTDLGAAGGRERAQVSARVNQALTRFGAGWMFHFSTERVAATEYPQGSDFNDPSSWIIDEVRRITFGQEGNHYTNDYWIDVTYLPPSDSENRGQEFFIEGQTSVGADYAATENIKTFNDMLKAFEDVLREDLYLERIGLKQIDTEEGTLLIDEQIAHLIKCAINRDIIPRRTYANEWISPIVAAASIRNGFRLRIGDQLLSVFTISEMPDYAKNGMFDILAQIGCEYRATWRYIVREQDSALTTIKKERDKWYGKRRSATDALQNKETPFPNQDALKMSADATLAETDANSNQAIFGYFTMSVTIWEKIQPNEEEDVAWARLMKNQDYITSNIHRHLHFQTFHEQENVLEAHLGSLPGVGHAQLRKPMLSSKNLADFVPTSSVWAGDKYNPCKFYPNESPPLSYVSTTGGTPFSFNIHVGDVGNFFVTGQIGAGKSVLLGFLLAQHRRYSNSRQIIFDVDRSHYVLTNSVGGKHYEVRPDGTSVGFAPLAHIDEDSERLWAESWILTLVENSGMVSHDRIMSKREQVVKALYLLSKQPKPWSLTSLVTMPMLDKEVKDAIRTYTVSEEGLGGLLDAEEDTLTTADFICFEMRPIMDAAEELKVPTLMYLFHYVDRLCNGRPTILLMEEVWSFLQNDQSVRAIQDWLKTLRKRNVAVGFANQNLDDFIKHPLSATLIQACFTKILLANPEATTEQQRSAYEKIGLTSWQIQQLSKAKRKRDYFVMSPLGRRLIALDLEPVALTFVGISEVNEVNQVRKMIEDEIAYLAEHPNPPLTEHIPWQARLLKERVEKSSPGLGLGEGWARKWLEQWREMGGYARFAP